MTLKRQMEEEVRHFRTLDPLRPDQLTEQASGAEIAMQLLTYIEGGSALVYDLVYRHRELEYLPSDPRNPIAHGDAHLEFHEEWRPVRRLFHTAGCTVRGLTFPGEMKLADPAATDTGEGG